MGNCLFGGLGNGVIKVITSSGGIMEFCAPITAGSISNELPGHAIFRSHDLFWRPLPLHEELLPGHSYYLLPINDTKLGGQQIVREGHVRSKSTPTNTLVATYRMSFDCQRTLKRSYTEAFSRGVGSNGFWKVKLVISPEQLLEILSQEGRTQELIQNVRAVARCGNGTISSSSITSSSAAFSDQWSLSSSMNASSNKDDLLDI